MIRRRAFNGAHTEVYVIPKRASRGDFDLSVKSVFPAFLKTVKDHRKKQSRRYALKFQIRMLCSLDKFSYELNREINVEVWFPSDTYNAVEIKNVKAKIIKACADVYKRFDSFVQRGSGWVLRRVIKFSINIMKYQLFQGGCLSKKLPVKLRSKRCFLSIHNTEKNKCFHYCIAAGIGAVRKNKSRNSKYYGKIISLLPFEKMNIPISLKEVQKFEKKSIVSVNVYGFEDIIFPMHISAHVGKQFHVDLLLHNDHYYLITNMGAMLGLSGKCNRRKTYVCQYCLCYFIKFERFEMHKNLCFRNNHQYEMPVIGKNNLSFANFHNMIESPFVMYCDLETMITERVLLKKGKVYSKRDHIPISFGALTVCRPHKYFGSYPQVYTGLDCVDKLFAFISSEAQRIAKIINQFYAPLCMTAEDKNNFQQADKCFMCKKKFSDFPHIKKVRDHCHLSGRYRFALCSTCNLTRAKSKAELHVFFHGLSHYDSHFLIQKMNAFKSSDIRVIPKNSEKYLTFSIGDVHFKDSYHYLSESLSVLVKNLLTKGVGNFFNVNNFIKKKNKRELFLKKGIFPYNYLKEFSVLCEKKLPEKEVFYNDLLCEHVSQADYEFALKVWGVFKCKNIRDYLEVYLLADVLLLADVFENFRNNCLQEYHIDPVYYFSSPHFTFDAFLYKSQITLELLSDINQYLFIMNGIRGGLSMVSKRYSLANNQLLGNYDRSRKSIFLIDIDANNLYGKAMQQYLPQNKFRWMQPHELDCAFITSLPDQGPVGCIIQCSLIYPRHLHNDHNDYPLAPEKKKIKYKELSPEAKIICDKHSLKRTTNVEKLMATLGDKEEYILHYRNLKLYLSLGMKLKTIQAGILFFQAPIMKDYIDFNSKKRALSTNDYDKDFYKLLCNSLYGKTIENPEKRSKIKLCTDRANYMKMVGKPTFKNAKYINPNVVGVEFTYPRLKINKPFYIGMSILDLSKMLMYDFHYNVMKKIFGPRIHLLYTDTDSLMYEIESEDVYEELSPYVATYFDTSNYPTTHNLFNSGNKKIPGFFKDETASAPIKEFVGLRSKMYSFIVQQDSPADQKEVKVAKGVHRAVISKDLKFKSYLKCLRENIKTEHEFSTIRSVSHIVSTYNQKKVTLCPFDDKRYLVDSINSLAYGHYSLDSKNVAVDK